MLFRFALRSIDEITPWGTGSKRFLHWFGLTDGWSWMDVGTAELFRYTPEILSHWGLSTERGLCSYADYQVIRLWEDLWAMLPFALEPVPADVLEQRPLVERIERKLSIERGASNEDQSLFEDAIDWWEFPRHLSTLHLAQGPKIRLWRSGETVHVEWDNRDLQIDGLHVWTADRGLSSYTLNDFVSEVRDFHGRLGDAMRPRVERIRNEGPPVGVRIDVDELSENQAGWDAGLSDPLARLATTDWDQVRIALNEARSLLD